MKICIIGDERHLDEAKANGFDYRSLDDLKKLNKDKKLVKKLGKSCMTISPQLHTVQVSHDETAVRGNGR